LYAFPESYTTNDGQIGGSRYGVQQEDKGAYNFTAKVNFCPIIREHGCVLYLGWQGNFEFTVVMNYQDKWPKKLQTTNLACR